MKKTFALYIVGIAIVGLAIWQPTFGWLSPVVFVFVLPACAIWFWRSEGRTLQDLGLRRDIIWRQFLIWGLLLGLLIPVIVVFVQVLNGWISLTPRVLTYRELAVYIEFSKSNATFISVCHDDVYETFWHGTTIVSTSASSY